MPCCGSAKPQVVRPNVSPVKQSVKVYDFSKKAKVQAAPQKVQRNERCVVCGYPTMTVNNSKRTRTQCTNPNCKHIQ